MRALRVTYARPKAQSGTPHAPKANQDQNCKPEPRPTTFNFKIIPLCWIIVLGFGRECGGLARQTNDVMSGFVAYPSSRPSSEASGITSSVCNVPWPINGFGRYVLQGMYGFVQSTMQLEYPYPLPERLEELLPTPTISMNRGTYLLDAVGPFGFLVLSSFPESPSGAKNMHPWSTSSCRLHW
ncbi:hypothetical protein BDP81DRAFT_164921 [Colletotrichum phormii]|uniref:Uncharacterized protein n=1 Tax=Colletotrichum phormii TaxID=359342 RepID=A0AAI9ZYE2_9PEZI|nr:uncharacterized protein BDP81DRAFT_164921 [Colletotrichum phormii]KAK1640535.1 hypothetical protein BDP81DRAFT_164921 [Colletotrichum phormii]